MRASPNADDRHGIAMVPSCGRSRWHPVICGASLRGTRLGLAVGKGWRSTLRYESLELFVLSRRPRASPSAYDCHCIVMMPSGRRSRWHPVICGASLRGTRLRLAVGKGWRSTLRHESLELFVLSRRPRASTNADDRHGIAIVPSCRRSRWHKRKRR